MRICFASDFHGSEDHYRQFDALLRQERPDLAILGGDNFPDGDLDDPLGTQGKYINEVFAQRLALWRELLPAMRVACILGNHDWRCALDVLREFQQRGELTVLEPQRPWNCNGVAFLGYSYTPPTPYWVKDFERLDLPGDPIPDTGGAVWDAMTRSGRKAEPQEHFASQPTLSADLERVSAPTQPWILVCHAPPYDTGLDRLPHLDYPIGSRAVRAFIEARRPICALHGHIHESPNVTGAYRATVGATLCVNPGQAAERMHAVLFDSSRPAETMRHTVFG